LSLHDALPISSTASAIAVSARGSSSAPPASGIPLTLFSMHVQSELFSGMPWPSVSFGSMRLWDTYTTWNDLNPSAGNFNWPALDRWLDAAQQHGVDVIYTFGATPTWASSNPTGKCDYNPGACYPPANMQDWDNFVRAVATHAVGRIKYWEMWNEANQHGYWSGSIPALVTMTQHASAIIKSVGDLRTTSPGTMRGWPLSRGTIFCSGRKACSASTGMPGMIRATEPFSNPARVRSKKQVWHTHRWKGG